MKIGNPADSPRPDSPGGFNVLRFVDPGKVAIRTGIAKLVSSYGWVSDSVQVKELALDVVRADSLQAVAVINDQEAPVGLIVKRDFQEQLAQLYWRDIHKNERVAQHVIRVPCFDAEESILTVAEQLSSELGRARVKFFNVAKEGRYFGTFSSLDLLGYLTDLTRKDISLAASLQKRISPDRLAMEFEEGSLYSISKMAQGVGGDFLQVRPVQTDGNLGLLGAVCDVSGKGIAAALVTAILSGMLEGYQYEEATFPDFLNRLDRFISESFELEKFVTAVFFHWRPLERRIEFYDFGHSLIYLYRKGARMGHFHHVKSGSPCLPLGVQPDQTPHRAVMQLESGDVLLILTDGVSEQGNDAGQDYGTQRLAGLVHRAVQLGDVGNLPEWILRDVLEFKNTRPQADDITLMVLKQE